MLHMFSFYKWALLCLISIGCYALHAQPLVSNGTNLRIQSGLSITVQGGLFNTGDGILNHDGILHIQGDITNNSTQNLSSGLGEIKLSGNSLQLINGSNVSRFFKLSLDNVAGFALGQGIEISDQLDMINGALDLNGNQIEIGPFATISGESNSKRIFGSSGEIATSRDLGTPSGNNIAGMGIAISTPTDLGMTRIIRRHGTLNVGGGSSITRSFEILPTNNSGLAANLRFAYFSDELNGQNPATLLQWRLVSGAANWTPGFGTINGTGYAEGGPYDEMGLWTLSSNGTSAQEALLPALELHYYPNPLSQHKSLSIAGLKRGDYQLHLFDMRGKKLWELALTVSVAEDLQTIMLPALAEGLYSLHLISDKYAPSTKILRIQP